MVTEESPDHSIKEPIPAIFRAWELLSNAADSHLNGNRALADTLFRRADLPEVWNWINPAWCRPDLNVKVPQPDGETQEVPKAERDPRRDPVAGVKAAVLSRDGYRCRYCGIPVIDAGIRKIAHALYPDAISWDVYDVHKQHAAFQCLAELPDSRLEEATAEHLWYLNEAISWLLD